ncbi:MAG TPA: hypothetical protein VHG10_13455 [Glycomyces sp.]|nr:hypothetical protein [Glycomyces sp.]
MADRVEVGAPRVLPELFERAGHAASQVAEGFRERGRGAPLEVGFGVGPFDGPVQPQGGGQSGDTRADHDRPPRPVLVARHSASSV